jgi:hypothetical protein
MDEVRKYVRTLVVAPCELEQLKDTDVGLEQVQVEVDSGPRSKCIGEIFLGHMPARGIVTESYLHGLDHL